ncbi:DUF3024 domain-containing protein [Trichloromonas sp.]|uniref:DUF3024 domain-containing protein n=1 Tax=Trichloromonas sp. TaxID=3069249 RepID=UPI002A3E4916|nr:DUF3024 domain-containing protein [Trichloromonas sp.]
MELPELLRKSADKLLGAYCAGRPLARHSRHFRLIYRINGVRATLIEEQFSCPACRQRTIRPIAQFRYHAELTQWSLHYYLSDRRTWAFYLNCRPSLNLAGMLRHVDADPLRMFWE